MMKLIALPFALLAPVVLAALPPPAHGTKESTGAAPTTVASASAHSSAPISRLPDGNGDLSVTGSLLTWHKITVGLAGPYASEQDTAPNPFTDYAFMVTFAHDSGQPKYTVPGYFAADGQAAESSATAGTVWRAHFAADKPGLWHYRISFRRGPLAAVQDTDSTALAPYDGRTGSFTVAPTDKTGPDFRAKGRLMYVGKHHLQFAGTGEWFFKVGPDAPETLLGTADFDGTEQRKKNVPLKSWKPHLPDWREGDPTWQGGKGKGLIGALNYLAGKGLNAFSFLTYNAGGDGDNVWPYVARDDKRHFDCSKLDQWGIVFDHATSLGLYLHFKLQETENDDNRFEVTRTPRDIPESLDGGQLGIDRKLYLRELIARFGHELALNWNLGEENTQTPDEQRAMAAWIARLDPYRHPIVIHSYPEDQEKVYPPLLGQQSVLTGASLQNDWAAVHERTVRWIQASAAASRPWVVANDEQGPHYHGVPPDPGYKGFSGTADDSEHHRTVDLHQIRKYTLWGNLMAGGAGVEYYFGYKLPETDLDAEDFRSRDRSWDFCRIARDFLQSEAIPFWKMHNADALVDNPKHDNRRFCLIAPNELYLVYLPNGGGATLDLSDAGGPFELAWFNPRTGGAPAAAGAITGGATVTLTAPADDDWLAIVRAAATPTAKN